MIKIKKGLDLPIEGSPEEKIYPGATVTKVALLGDDVVGMKPTMKVKVGDKVKIGQVLYADKKTEGVNYTSPAAGEVIEINRGERRVFQSVVIKLEEDAYLDFQSYKGADLSSYDKESLQALLLESGAWVNLRQRPFSKVAAPGTTPQAIVVSAMDTQPLTIDPQLVVAENKEAFELGLKSLKLLTDKVFMAVAPHSNISSIEGVKKEEFQGPHPAGLPGTHIHFLAPVNMEHITWYIGYQELIAIGKLIQTGKISTEKIVSLAGPVVKKPRYIRTRQGASLEELTAGEANEEVEARVISGSVFGGRNAQGPFAYLGRFHNQITLLAEGRQREFLGWHSPGVNKFSVKPIYLSSLIPNKKYAFNTNENGSHRSIVPIRSYEKVMPLDILATQLAKYLHSNNLEMCVNLGALELDEEDVALMTFVDPCKNDFGRKLREKLTIIEKEG